MKKTDTTILTLLKEGDKMGLEMLFREYYRPLVMYASQYLERKEEAEDLVQDVFVKFWESRQYLEININLRSYIYQTVRNASLNTIKSKSKYQFDTLDDLPELSVEEMLDESDWNEYINDIYKRIDMLPPRTRKIFTSIILENKKYKDVAADMNISVNTVKTSLSRALSVLRSNLSKSANVVLTLLLI